MTNTSVNDFLPENYEAPSGSAYMKLQDGDNKFRILSKPIIGWLDWKDKKPFRFRMDSKPEKPMTPDKPIKHFWAFLVWNYEAQAVQILEITQATIQRTIQDLSKNEDWGAPFFYDIKVTRKGKDLATEYSVMPSPKKDLLDDIKKAALEKPAYLEALFDNADPWVVNGKQTEYAFESLPF